ncbi:MAG: alpha-mannosidase [Flavobacteriales bacterium]|nr:MAG: alpha-mannosidase [Flavobacteriales bacterium]
MPYSRNLFFVTIILLFISCKPDKNNTFETVAAQSDNNLIDYVDPFIGTGGHGHTYPGATAPFGRIQPSPDNGTEGWDWCSGYHISDTIISGFSQLHLSGTGIGDLADVLLMPTNKQVDLKLFGTSKDSLPYTDYFSHKNEEAIPGFYKVVLNNTKTEISLTANDYVAYHKYEFYNNHSPSFIIDLGFKINWDKPTNTKLVLENENRITGYRYSTGWAKNQKVFFVIDSDKPIKKHQFISDGKVLETVQAKGIKTGGQFFFDNNTEAVNLKVAVSSVSIENAIDNLSKYGKTSFEETKNNTADAWNTALGKITVETPIDSLKTIFYTALYHAQVAPTLFSDANGQYRLQNDSITTAKGYRAYSTLSLWDVFRTQIPMLTLTDKQLINDLVKTMLVYYKANGNIPVWILSGNETYTMPGYHGVSVIAEAYMKGIRDYDVNLAYEAVKNTMMGNDRGLEYYKKYGYVPYDKMYQSVSISLNYAYNDYCVAQMAKDLNKEKDYKYFIERSGAYLNFFDKNSGFLRGLSSNGKDFHQPFNPKKANHLEDNDYTEGNAWQHSFYVLHGVEDLIRLHGSDDNFAKMVEQLYNESSELFGDNVSVDISGLIGQYAHGNEPSHHIAYMFNKAKKPWLTQYWVRQILNTQYTTKPDGLSGNEDCGQMSSWYIMSSIGLYPVNPVSGEFEIGSPIFTKATIKLSNGKNFVIEAPNASETNIYVQSVKLNDNNLDRTYITYNEIMQGGILTLEMGAKPNKNR